VSDAHVLAELLYFLNRCRRGQQVVVTAAGNRIAYWVNHCSGEIRDRKPVAEPGRD